jgi:uncharacterized protein with ATP-grasp and redox domains
MQNLNFDDGYKEFSINGDETRVIRFNPADFGILERIKEAYEEIEKATNIKEDIELNADGSVMDKLSAASSVVSSIDNTIKAQIDHIFNSNVSEVAFGNQSAMGMVKGVPLYERFLNAIIPVIKQEVEKEMRASQKRIKKYTDVVK